ncbi:FK506 binding protein [Aureococcus anophagefferens]|nr:FK506 binding protein [Aureococcus anophagefferens]
MADDPNGEAAGIAFLEANRAKPGVVSLPTGLQYKVLVEGAGLKHPTVDSPCECHYAGMLLDGTTFDSSYKRGKPSTFAPNQVIKGWTQAMQLMVVGDKWEMYIPYELAYGANGKPPKIPAKAMLIFVMEIVRIKGDSTPVTNFPAWAPDDLALWTAKDEAACDAWREAKAKKYEAGDEKLLAKYADRGAFDAWLDKQCLSTKNQALWKRTKARRAAARTRRARRRPTRSPSSTPRSRGSSSTAASRPSPCPRRRRSSSRSSRTSRVRATSRKKGMLRMVKLMPVVSEILAPVLDDHGYAKDDLMTVAMQLQGFAAEDPTIGVDTMKLIKAVQGDLSDFV